MFKELLTEEDKAIGRKALDSLKDPVAGLLHRRPNANTVMEAHDNYDGAVALAHLCDDKKLALDICAYGEKHGWSFANTAAGTFSWKQLRQGGSIAYYKIGAGIVPYPLEALWLWLGMIHAMLFGWPSPWNLAWLKIQTLPSMVEKEKNDMLWIWVKQGSRLAVFVCVLIDIIKERFPDSFLNYFGPLHVFTRAAKVKYKRGN
jgi:hypothetical protein